MIGKQNTTTPKPQNCEEGASVCNLYMYIHFILFVAICIRQAEEKYKSMYGRMRVEVLAGMNLRAIYCQGIKRLRWNENKPRIPIFKSPA